MIIFSKVQAYRLSCPPLPSHPDTYAISPAPSPIALLPGRLSQHSFHAGLIPPFYAHEHFRFPPGPVSSRLVFLQW